MQIHHENYNIDVPKFKPKLIIFMNVNRVSIGKLSKKRNTSYTLATKNGNIN